MKLCCKVQTLRPLLKSLCRCRPRQKKVCVSEPTWESRAVRSRHSVIGAWILGVEHSEMRTIEYAIIKLEAV